MTSCFFCLFSSPRWFCLPKRRTHVPQFRWLIREFNWNSPGDPRFNAFATFFLLATNQSPAGKFIVISDWKTHHKELLADPCESKWIQPRATSWRGGIYSALVSDAAESGGRMSDTESRLFRGGQSALTLFSLFWIKSNRWLALIIRFCS